METREMSTIHAGLQSVPVTNFISTGAVEPVALCRVWEDEAGRERWDETVDRLIGWWKSVADLEEDDLVPPARPVIESALRIAPRLCDVKTPPPLRIVPDGEGGIAFEWRHGNVFISMQLDEDNTVTLLRFEDSRLVRKHHGPVPE